MHTPTTVVVTPGIGSYGSYYPVFCERIRSEAAVTMDWICAHVNKYNKHNKQFFPDSSLCVPCCGVYLSSQVERAACSGFLSTKSLFMA